MKKITIVLILLSAVLISGTQEPKPKYKSFLIGFMGIVKGESNHLSYGAVEQLWTVYPVAKEAAELIEENNGLEKVVVTSVSLITDSQSKIFFDKKPTK